MGEYLKDPGVKALPRTPGILLLFGQGPVLNKKTRDEQALVAGSYTTADINYWSKEVAIMPKEEAYDYQIA